VKMFRRKNEKDGGRSYHGNSRNPTDEVQHQFWWPQKRSICRAKEFEGIVAGAVKPRLLLQLNIWTRGF
jgi:hypothetical protein